MCILLAGAIFLPSMFVPSNLPAKEVRSVLSSGEGLTDAPTVEEVKDFFAGLEWLSSHYKITIVAEDVPFQCTLSDTEAEKILDVIKKKKGDNLAILDIFARAYDYNVVRYKTNCVLLTKRFTSDTDLACVTLEEWTDAIQVVDRNLRLVAPGPDLTFTLGQALPGDGTSNNLIRSFSPEQVSRIQAPKGLPISALRASQKADLSRLCRSTYFESPLFDIQNVLAQTKCVSDKETKFGWFDTKNGNHPVRVFGYEGIVPLRFDRKRREASSAKRLRILSPDWLWVDANGMGLNFPVGLNQKDETTPDPVSAQESSAAIKAGDGSITLAEMFSWVGGRNTFPPGSTSVAPSKFVVAPMLSAKRVTVAGRERCSITTLFRGVGKLYGLDVRYEPKEDTYFLERASVRFATGHENFRATLLAALPAPFLRSVRVGPDGSDRGSRRRLMPGLADKAGLTDKDGKLPYRSDRLWRVAAVKELRTSVEPLVSGDSQRTILGSRLPISANIALANLMMSDAYRVLHGMTVSPVPSYLTDFESLVLTGGPNTKDGVDWFSVSVHSPRSNGTLQPHFGLNERITGIEIK